MKKVTIYSKQYCPYCIEAIELMTHKPCELEVVDVGRDHILRQQISKANGNWATVPMIFIGEQFIGGYSELNQLERKGDLDRML